MKFWTRLPEGQDPNYFFNSGHDIFDFQKLISEAHKFDSPGVISIGAAIDLLQQEAREGKSESGLLTPWPTPLCSGNIDQS